MKERIAQKLGQALDVGGFRALHSPAVAGVTVNAAWVRKTWVTNRAVFLFEAGGGTAPIGRRSQQIKIAAGKSAKYFPFFYGVGMQFVWWGPDLTARAIDLQDHVDRLDNQRAILQSLFVVDTANRQLHTARTWGQVITGRFQDAIEIALRDVIGGNDV